MSIYILLLLLLKSFYCRSYEHWSKGAYIELSLKSNEEKGYYLDYSDVFEKDDVVKDNNLYFLKINRELKVNCIIQNGNYPPEETSFNRDKLNPECQLSIELNNNKKLVSFPKSLTNNDRLYFIFFLGNNNLGNDREDYLTETIYQIKRIAYPELLKVKDDPYELSLRKERTFIYLMKPEPENFNILSTLSNFNISIYGYKKDKNFEQLGYIGENNFIFQLNDSLELDSNYTFIVINNEDEEIKKVQFSYNEQIRLRTLNLAKTSSVDYTNFRTALSLLQIYNPQQKILKFTHYADHWIRVLDENHSNMKQILDLSFYKYIPQGYFYQPTEYTIFLINTGHRNNKFTVETVTLSNEPNSIEMDKFIYFQIFKGSSLSFNVNFPENKIIVKLMSTNNGNVLINGQNYQLTQQNQILEIDNENKSKFTIKAVDKGFMLAVKSKISEKYIHYTNLPFNVPTNNEKAFIAVKVDYNNKKYDYASFSIIDNNNKINNVFSSDFGFLTENEFSINSMREHNHIYDLKYYKAQKKQDLLKIYYVPNITSSSDIALSGCYYPEVKYLPNKFQRFWDELVLFVGKKRTRLFFITENYGYLYVYCKGTIRGSSIRSEYFDNFSSDDLNCYEEIYISGYIYIQPYENDKEFYSFDQSLRSNISLEVKDKKTIQVAFAYNFTNTSELNFTLIISKKENENHFNSNVRIFEYFYLNNTYNKSEFELYKFTLKNMSINESNIGLLNLETPKNFIIYEKNKSFIYTLIGESSPVKMFYIYKPKIFQYEGKYPPSDGTKKEENHLVLIIIIVIAVIIVLLIVAFLLIRFKNKNKDNLEYQIDQNKGMDLPLQDN